MSARVRYACLSVILILSILYVPFTPAKCSEGELDEGDYPLYLVKEVVEVTTDYTRVQWLKGPDVVVVRHKILEGAEAPELEYTVSGLEVEVKKQSFDATRVVIEVEALVFMGENSALVTVEIGNIPNTVVTLSVYNVTSGNFEYLHEMVYKGVYPLDFEIDLSKLYETTCTTAMIKKAIMELDKQVLAFYYQWYLTPEGPSGQTFHWDDGYANFPLMGLYDSTDERVIYAHMVMAKYAGIDGFIADYPFRGELPVELWDTILRIAEEIGIKITHYGLWSKDLPEILDSVSHPIFLKDSGRPVSFFYGPQAANASSWVKYRNTMEESIGPVVWIGNTVDDQYLGAFDGFHMYVYITLYPEDDGMQYYSDAIERMDKGLSIIDVDEAFSMAYAGEQVAIDLKPFFVTVVPGVDTSQVRPPGIIRDREDGELYARLWRTATELDAYSVLITSWNEWHEGTDIEPSKEYGFKYLNSTRRFVEEYKQISIPTPEPTFSANVESFYQYQDLTGQGNISLAASDSPALYVNVTVRGEDATNLDLEGDYYTYLKDQDESRASTIIPSIRPFEDLSIKFIYTTDTVRPLFNFSVTVYDPIGRHYELLKESLRPITPTYLTVSTLPESIELGDSITVSGFISPELEDRAVTITYTKPDSLAFTRTTTTAVDGGYQDTFEPDPVGSWSVETSWEGDEEYEGSTSSIVQFTVTKNPSSISIQTSKSQITEEDSITVSGSLSPEVTGAEVIIDFTKPDGSTFIKTVSTSSDGSYSELYLPTEIGSWSVKASWEGDSTYKGATSQIASFTVEEKQGIPSFPYESIFLGLVVGVLIILLTHRR